MEKLSELDYNEWWDVCRKIKPELTREEYDRMWEEFQLEKQYRSLQ